MFVSTRLIAVVAACVVAVDDAKAAFSSGIRGLHNTGVVSTGPNGAGDTAAELSPGLQEDFNWNVTYQPSDSNLPLVSGNAFAFDEAGFPITRANGQPGPYVDSPDGSRWIGTGSAAVSDDPDTGLPPVLYNFSTKFKIASNAEPLSLVINGMFSTDNKLTKVLVNGVETAIGVSLPSGSETFKGLVPFTLTLADFLFAPGSDPTTRDFDLTFVVQNLPLTNGNPVGLLVDFTSTELSPIGGLGGFDPVPEATSLLVWGASLGLAGLAVSRRKS